MYAARRRQKSVRGKFQLGKLRIGQQFQLFDNTLRQFPQGGFIGHQVALHQPQFVDKSHPGAGKRGMRMNFNHEELMLMMLYNSGTRLGLIHELRLMQCYLMPDETALRELSEGVIEKLKLLTDAEFAELEFPPN